MRDFGRSGYGGGGFGGFSLFPPVVKFLLISNIGIFLAQILFGQMYLFGASLNDYFLAYGALWPIGHDFFYPWQLLSYMFMHGGLGHVLMNMLALWMFGNEIENLWGSKKFLTFYLICGLGGALAHLIFGPAAPLVGASAGVVGVLAAFGLMFPDREIYFYFVIPIKAKYFVMGYIALEAFSQASGGGGGVSHLAHLGGAAAGMIYIVATTPGIFGSFRSRNRRQDDRWKAFENPWEQQRHEEPRKSGIGSFFKRPSREDETIDAEYYDVDDQPPTPPRQTRAGRVITQEDIDRILDKIAASGYQNLTEEEREILFEASRKMDERR